jgi:NADPH:quinone reductase-like Zn-dependent oxidoreductase
VKERQIASQVRCLIGQSIQGFYPFPTNFPVVGGSDGAGEIVEVGSKVQQWKKGDKVVTLFNQGHQFGPVTQAAAQTGLGGVLDGTLRQFGVFNENGLVRAPKNLDYVESSTLTCAGLTSWVCSSHVPCVCGDLQDY